MTFRLGFLNPSSDVLSSDIFAPDVQLAPINFTLPSNVWIGKFHHVTLASSNLLISQSLLPPPSSPRARLFNLQSRSSIFGLPACSSLHKTKRSKQNMKTSTSKSKSKSKKKKKKKKKKEPEHKKGKRKRKQQGTATS